MTAATPTNYSDPERTDDMHTISLDYDKTFADFTEVFDDFRPKYVGYTPIAGINFMTDDILGVWRIGNAWVELSTGVFLETRIFGVTIRKDLRGESGEGHGGGLIDSDKVATMEDVRAEFDKMIRPLKP